MTPNPFLASLGIGSGLGWPEGDLGVMGELCHVGARFEALDVLIFIALSISPFFYVPRFPSGTMCTSTAHWDRYVGASYKIGFFSF